MVQKIAVKHEFEAGLRHAVTGKLCQPSSKWVPFPNYGRIRQRNEGDGLCLSLAVSEIPQLPLRVLSCGKPLPYTEEFVSLFW